MADQLKMRKITSLRDLHQKAKEDKRYESLAIAAAQNLGSTAKDLFGAMSHLTQEANTTDEEGVVAEVNFCLPLVSK